MARLFEPANAQQAARPAILADLATNHGGSVDRALDLISSAKAAGADGVAVPVFEPAHLAEHLARRSGDAAPAAALQQTLRKLALDIGDLEEIREETEMNEMTLVLAPLCLADVALAGRVPCDGIFIPAGAPLDLTLVQAAATLEPPLLIGLARGDLEAALQAAELLRPRASGGVLIYAPGPWPREPKDMQLSQLRSMAQAADLPVGLADHSAPITTGAMAVAAGALVVLRAFSLNPDLPGPDQARSLDPVHFTHYAELAHQAAVMLGPAS